MCGTYSKWTRTKTAMNNTVRCVVNGCSQHMRPSKAQKRFTESNMRTHQYQHNITYNHLFSVHFVFVFSSHMQFSVDYTYRTKCLFCEQLRISRTNLGQFEHLCSRIAVTFLQNDRWVNIRWWRRVGHRKWLVLCVSVCFVKWFQETNVFSNAHRSFRIHWHFDFYAPKWTIF